MAVAFQIFKSGLADTAELRIRNLWRAARGVMLLGLLCLVGTCCTNARAAELRPEVSAWLAAQPKIQSWSADFVQTRSLKSLTQPLTTTGHVWFQAPNCFRWELGHPPQTIAVREPDVMLVIYPRLKRVERFPLTGQQTGPWRDALALLEAGFPRNAADLQAQYNVLSQEVTAGQVSLVLQPKSTTARAMMPRIAIGFDIKNYSLRATELQFADGSIMRNDFKDPERNPNIDSRMFAPEIPSDYKVVEPLKK